jgi:hypothetical protein
MLSIDKIVEAKVLFDLEIKYGMKQVVEKRKNIYRKQYKDDEVLENMDSINYEKMPLEIQIF